MNTLLKRRKRKSKRQAASIRNRLHQLESLEKRELLAGDLAGGNLVEMESSAKTEIKAAYVAPAPAAAVVQEAEGCRGRGPHDGEITEQEVEVALVLHDPARPGYERDSQEPRRDR